MKVRIGFGLGTRGLAADAAGYAALVDDLERIGFDSLWVSERATGPLPDPMIALAVAAGRTQRLKLGTSVQVLPGRNPILLAKAWASLDALSGGRALPAFGLGVVDPAEQQAFGVARGDRASLMNEVLPLLRRLWTGARVDHRGPRYTYRGAQLAMVPAHPLDVWLGGRAPVELRRVGQLADGWLPSYTTPAEAAAGRVVVEEAAAASGRTIDAEHYGALVPYAHRAAPPETVRAMQRRFPDADLADVVPVGMPGLRERLEEFVAVGFSKLVVVPTEEPASWRDELEQLGATLLPLET